MPSKHLFCKTIILTRNEKGEWIVSRIGTNQGKFALGDAENAEIQKGIVNDFASYVFSTIKPGIEGYLEEESKANESQANSTGETS